MKARKFITVILSGALITSLSGIPQPFLHQAMAIGQDETPDCSDHYALVRKALIKYWAERDDFVRKKGGEWLKAKAAGIILPKPIWNADEHLQNLDCRADKKGWVSNSSTYYQVTFRFGADINPATGKPKLDPSTGRNALTCSGRLYTDSKARDPNKRVTVNDASEAFDCATTKKEAQAAYDRAHPTGGHPILKGVAIIGGTLVGVGAVSKLTTGSWIPFGGSKAEPAAEPRGTGPTYVTPVVAPARRFLPETPVTPLRRPVAATEITPATTARPHSSHHGHGHGGNVTTVDRSTTVIVTGAQPAPVEGGTTIINNNYSEPGRVVVGGDAPPRSESGGPIDTVVQNTSSRVRIGEEPSSVVVNNTVAAPKGTESVIGDLVGGKRPASEEPVSVVNNTSGTAKTPSEPDSSVVANNTSGTAAFGKPPVEESGVDNNTSGTAAFGKPPVEESGVDNNTSGTAGSFGSQEPASSVVVNNASGGSSSASDSSSPVVNNTSTQ